MQKQKTWLITIALLYGLSPFSAAATDTGPEDVSVKGLRLGQSADEVKKILGDLYFIPAVEKAKKTYKVQGINIETEEYIAKISARMSNKNLKESYNIYFTSNEGGNMAHLIEYSNSSSRNNPYIASELREKMFQKFGGSATRSKGTGKFRELYKYYYTNGNRIACKLKDCPTPVTHIKSYDKSITKGDYNPFSTRISERIADGTTAAVHAQFEMSSVRKKGDTLYTSNFKIQLSGEAVRKVAGETEKTIIEAKAKEKAGAIQSSSVPDL